MYFFFIFFFFTKAYTEKIRQGKINNQSENKKTTNIWINFQEGNLLKHLETTFKARKSVNGNSIYNIISLFKKNNKKCITI